MGEEVVDALVLAARYDLQQLTVGERAAINSVDRVARAMVKLNGGQASPFREIGRDLIQSGAAFRKGEIDLEGLNIALQKARIDMVDLRARGIEPDAKALLQLTNVLDRTTMALARLNAAKNRGGGPGGRPPGGSPILPDLDPNSKVAKGADSAAAGVARLRSGMAQLAVMAANTTSPLAQVAQGFLFMAGASTGAIIALSAVVIAYEKFNEASRKAREEREKLNAALGQRITSALPEGTQISREVSAAEEKRALTKREILEIQKEENKALKDPMFSLANQIRLRKVLKDEAEAQRNVEEGLALIAQRTAEAGARATQETLQAQTALRRQLEASAQAAADFVRAMAALGQQTFGAQPGFVSQQETRAFEEQVRLAKQRTSEDLKDLEIKRAAANVKPRFEDDAMRLIREGTVRAIELEIQARQRAGDEQVKEVRRQEDILEATRETARAQEDHLRRVQSLGGGNTLGAAPIVQPDLLQGATRQTDADKAGLPSAAAIEAFGRDVATELRNASDAGLEKATISLPTQAQLAALAKDVRESLKIGIPSGQEVETLGRLVADRLKIPMPTPAEIQRLGQEFAQEFNISAALPTAQSLRDIASGFNLQLPTQSDVDHLRDALAQIPPVGLPTPAEVSAAWDAAFAAARKGLIAPILQGAQQQGLESGSGDARQQEKKDAKQIAAAMRQARVEIAGSVIQTLALGRGLNLAARNAVDLLSSISAVKQAKIDFKEAINDAGRLAADLEKVAAISSSIQAGIGLIGAGISIAGSLFGKSETEKEHESIRAQNENTLATERNTAAVERAQTSGGIAELEGLFDKIGIGVLSVIEQVARTPGFRGQGVDALDRELKKVGSSLEELDAAATARGLTLLDEKGHLVAGALEQLREELLLAAKAALELDDSIAARRSRAETEDKLGISARSDNDKVAALQRERDVQLDALELDPATEAKIRALDLATIEGRKAFLEFQRDLFRRATTEGGITNEELGKFANVDELTDSVDAAADAINAMEEAASEASKGLTNIPDTFKLVTAEWEARAKDAISPIGIRPGPTPISEPVGGFLPSQRGNDGSQLPKTEITGNTIVLQLSVSGSNKSAGDIARLLADELESRGLGTSGLAPAP